MIREEIVEAFRNQPEVDVLIVGGGINGIGTFRDLALQGVSVLLVDKADFCSGASAASSRMAHGGIRYLENGEFRLVRESLAERNRLLKNAPHAVFPLLFTIPVYSWFSGILNAPLKFLGLLKRPSERGAVVIKIGMTLYDWFTRTNRMTGTHAMLSRRDALQKHKHLNPQIVLAATYYDALMPQAERIGLEIVLDAEAESPQAHALNYTSVTGADGESVHLLDHVSGQSFAVKPQVVVNASGAWIDFVNGSMKRPTRFIGGTKGSHIVVDHPALLNTLNGSAIFFEHKDGRMCIFAPFHDKVIIGATDIRIENPDEAVCTDEEIDYFLGFTEQVLPGLKLDRSHIVYHFCGVRPLPNTNVDFAGLISRDHSIQVSEPTEATPFPIYSLVGGKWTTFRAFAEQTTDRVLAFLGRSRQSGTADLPIGGGKAYPQSEDQRKRWVETAAADTSLSTGRVTTLFERYGTRAAEVAQYIISGTDRPLPSAPMYSEREIMFLAEREKVVHLEDVILRRTILGLLGLANGDVLQQTAAALGSVLGWTPEQVEAEIEQTSAVLQRWHGVPAARLQLRAPGAHA